MDVNVNRQLGLMVSTVMFSFAMATPACRRSVAPEVPPVAWMVDLTGDTGLYFVYESGCSGRRFMPETFGAGVALFDFDNDGDLDIYLTNGHTSLPNTEGTRPHTNRLFRQDSAGRFSDVSTTSGLGDTGYGMGVAVGDVNNDGWLDVYVTNLGADRLYLNNGNGSFRDITSSAGIQEDGWSLSACFFDFDNDGYLDLYVSRYLDWHPDTQCFNEYGKLDYCGPLAFSPVHDILFRNLGADGAPAFEDISAMAGMTSVSAPGMGVLCEDVTGDGIPDVYVANDQYPNHLWVNLGNGTFAEEALERGVAYNGMGLPEGGMGLAAFDYDGDSDIDLYVTNFAQETNTLYENLGHNRGYVDATSRVGLSVPSVPWTGFGTAAWDVELDGDLDLVVVNGGVKLAPPLPGAPENMPLRELVEPNQLYVNNGAGGFTSGGVEFAALTTPLQVSRGLALGDLDNDGDQDVVVTNIEGPARIYRNDAPRQGAWLSIRAIDAALRRDAIGAQVTVAAGTRRFVRTISGSYSYLSSSDFRAHFGLGDITRIDYVEVRWPGGLCERFFVDAVNTFVQLERGLGNRP
jgi:hypothetical protein